MKKRGELTVNQIIVIGLALFVFVVVIFFVFGGFKYVKSLWGGSYNDVSLHVTECNSACDAGESRRYDFCSVPRTVKFGKEVNYNGEMVDSVSMTCAQLGDAFRVEGFRPCPNRC